MLRNVEMLRNSWQDYRRLQENTLILNFSAKQLSSILLREATMISRKLQPKHSKIQRLTIQILQIFWNTCQMWLWTQPLCNTKNSPKFGECYLTTSRSEFQNSYTLPLLMDSTCKICTERLLPSNTNINSHYCWYKQSKIKCLEPSLMRLSERVQKGILDPQKVLCLLWNQKSNVSMMLVLIQDTS